MFSERQLRHLPFFEELARLEEDSDDWRAMTAGLVTLRLVDSWLESGVGNAADDEWNFRSVCASVDAMTGRSQLQSLLTSVLMAMRDGKPNVRAVVPSLMAYAKAIEWEGKWELAADVYHSLLAHLHPVEDSESCIAAHRRLGVCYKTLSRWDAAMQAYGMVFDIGNASGDLEAVLQARTGEADVMMLRGNLPGAAAKYDALIEAATTDDLRDVRARALAGRSSVAALADQYELAIVGSSRVDLQACKLEYSIVSPK